MSLTVAADRRLGWCLNAPVTSFCSEELFVNYIKFCSFLVRPGRAGGPGGSLSGGAQARAVARRAR